MTSIINSEESKMNVGVWLGDTPDESDIFDPSMMQDLDEHHDDIENE